MCFTEEDQGENKRKREKTYTSKFKVICQSSGERENKPYYHNDLYPAKFEKSLKNSRETPTSSSSFKLQYQNDEFQNEPIQIQGNRFLTYFHVTI